MVENTDTSKWYVVHCHSGFEKKVADSILDEAKKVNLEDSISEVSVPTQAVVEVRRGVRVNSEKKFFPGYVLIKMIMKKMNNHLKDIELHIMQNQHRRLTILMEFINVLKVIVSQELDVKYPTLIDPKLWMVFGVQKVIG